MTIKRITSMTTPEYQAFVKRLEKRYGPDKKWADIASIPPSVALRRASNGARSGPVSETS